MSAHKCYLNGGITTCQASHLNKRVPRSISLRLATTGEEALIHGLGSGAQRVRRRWCEAFGTMVGMWTRPKHVFLQTSIVPKGQRPTGCHQWRDAEGELAGKYDIWGKGLKRVGGAKTEDTSESSIPATAARPNRIHHHGRQYNPPADGESKRHGEALEPFSGRCARLEW
jgi:hypothetical protein